MSELKVTTLKHADSAVDSIVMASDGTLAFGAAVADSAGVAVKGGVPAQAWVNFDGTGTVAIRRAFNVSSITDNGTGSYTLNFTTALPDTNYAISAMSGRGSVNYDEGAGQDWLTLPTTSSCRIWIGSSNGGKGDYPYAHVTIFS